MIIYKEACELAAYEFCKAMLSDDEIDILYTFAVMLSDAKHGKCSLCPNHDTKLSRDKLVKCYKCRKKCAPFEDGVSMEDKEYALDALFKWLRVEWLIRRGWTTDLGMVKSNLSQKEIEVNHAEEIRILSKKKPEELIAELAEARKLLSNSKRRSTNVRVGSNKYKATTPKDKTEAKQVNNAVNQAMSSLFDS